MKKSIGYILPTYNEKDRIDAVLTYYSAFDIQVIVVDNYSTDETAAIASTYPFTLTVLNKNSGTTETREWTDWLLDSYPFDYYVFFSCSERLSPRFMSSISDFHVSGLDLVYVNRSSFTGSSPSLVFDHPLDLLFFRQSYLPCCRFVSARCLASIEINIHANFRPYRTYWNSKDIYDPEFAMIHIRPVVDCLQLRKMLEYASIDACLLFSECGSGGRQAFRLVLRELVVLLILMLQLRLTSIRKRELFARVAMHLQFYVLSSR